MKNDTATPNEPLVAKTTADDKPKKTKKSTTKGKTANGPEKSAYETFVEENKKPWIWFNVFCTLGSIALAIGTFMVVWNAEFNCRHQDLKFPLYMTFVMHCVNAIETMINLIGVESKICQGWIACGFFIFEVTVLIYIQIAYFES